MPYIGNQPGTGVRNRFIYTATASQTTFSGADDNGKTLKYADSDFVDVFLNGICLVPVTDYTSTSKTSIVLTQAASLNDTLEVVAYDIATISDTVSKADGGTFNDGITITTADNTTQLTLESTDADASVGPVLDLHRNSSSPADADTIGEIAFKGQNDADETLSYGFIKGFISDASDGTEDGQLNVNTMVGGTTRQRIKMDSTATVFNEEGRDIDFRVESDDNANMLFVDGGNDVVVIGSDVAENRLAQPLAVTTAGNRGGVTVNSFFNSASGPIMDFQVSRNNTAGSHTIIQTDDALGTILFRGDDGDEFKDAGAIECNVDASPGNDDMSGRLSFFTAPDGSSGLSERWRINSNGNFSNGDGDRADLATGFSINQGATLSMFAVTHTSGILTCEVMLHIDSNAGYAGRVVRGIWSVRKASAGSDHFFTELSNTSIGSVNSGVVSVPTITVSSQDAGNNIFKLRVSYSGGGATSICRATITAVGTSVRTLRELN